MSEMMANEARGIKCGRGNHYHPSVADVRRCFNGETDVPTSVPTPALDGGADDGSFVAPSKPQMRYLKDLLNRDRLVIAQGLQNVAKRQASELISLLTDRRAAADARFRKVDQPAYCRHDDCWLRAEIAVTGSDKRDSGFFCDKHAGAAKRRDFNNRLSVTPLTETAETRRADATKPKPVPRDRFDPNTLESGFYVKDEEVFKVVFNVAQGDGTRAYAKRLNGETGEWEMARGAIRTLRPEMKMSLEQALEVAKSQATNVESRLYGRCFVCGRELTHEDSIDRMMGPVCAGKFA